MANEVTPIIVDIESNNTNFELFLEASEHLIVLKRLSRKLDYSFINYLLEMLTKAFLDGCDENCCEDARKYFKLATIRDDYMFSIEEEALDFGQPGEIMSVS